MNISWLFCGEKTTTIFKRCVQRLLFISFALNDCLEMLSSRKMIIRNNKGIQHKRFWLMAIVMK